MKNAARNFLTANKIIKDREIILKNSLIAACEVLKNNFNFTPEQLESFSANYINEIGKKLNPGNK